MKRTLIFLVLFCCLSAFASAPYVPMYNDGSVPQALKASNVLNVLVGTHNGTHNGNAIGLTNVPGTNILGQITTTNSPDSVGRMQFFNPRGYVLGNTTGGTFGAMVIDTNNTAIVRLLSQEPVWFVFGQGTGSPYFDENVHAAYFTGSGSTLNDLPFGEHILDQAMPVPFLGWNSILDTNVYGGFPATYPSGAAITNVVTRWSTNGLLAAGYNVIWIDDFWQSNTLAANGNGFFIMQQNPTYFPDTMQHYAAYVHANGFKLGIYTSSGDVSCSGLPATPFESIAAQAQQYSDWGVDFVKVDVCQAGTSPAQPNSQLNDVAYNRAWAWAVAQLGWHNNNTNKMGLLFTTLALNSGEIITPEQVNEMNVFENNAGGGYPANNAISDMPSVMTLALARNRNSWAQRVGHWNELTSGGESVAHSTNTWQAYMSMNAMMSSPMYTAIGNGTFTGGTGPGYTLPYLTNQDVLYVRTNTYTPCTMTFSNALVEVWLKPIVDIAGNPASAVVLANMSSSPQTIGINFNPSAGQVIPSQQTNRWVTVHDCWANTNSIPFYGSSGLYTMVVPPTNVALLEITNTYSANDYTHVGAGIYQAGSTAPGNGTIIIGDLTPPGPFNNNSVTMGNFNNGTFAEGANIYQWNNQANTVAGMSLKSVGGGMILGANGAGLTNLWAYQSNNLAILTPEQFGAVGDGVTDDSVAVNLCEATAEALIQAGTNVQSQYNPEKFYKMTAPFVLKTRFNIAGRSYNWSGTGFTPDPFLATIVSSANPAVKCWTTNNSIVGARITGVSVFSSNYWFNNNPPNIPTTPGINSGQVGFSFMATNTGIHAFEMSLCQAIGFDKAILMTNINDANIDDVTVGNCTNGLIVQSDGNSGGFATQQGCSIHRLRGNCYGTHLALYNTTGPFGVWNIQDCDLSGANLDTNQNIVHLQKIIATIINPNWEGQSLNPVTKTGEKTSIFSLDNSKAYLFGGNMNLSSVPTFTCSNSQSEVHFYGKTPLSQDGSTNFGIFIGAALPNSSTYENIGSPSGSPTFIKCTNATTGTTIQLTSLGDITYHALFAGQADVLYAPITIGVQDNSNPNLYSFTNTGSSGCMVIQSPNDNWFFNQSGSTKVQFADSQIQLGGAIPGVQTGGGNGPGLYFTSNNTANAGSLFSDPANGLLYVRSNSAWYKVGIAASPGR